MKLVTITETTPIGAKTYFPGVAVVADSIATALDELNVLSGEAIDYRPPNPFNKMVFRGPYDVEVAYVAGDVVTDSGSTYVALTDSVGEDVEDEDFFVPFALEGFSTELVDLLAAIPVENVAVLGSTAALTALVPAATALTPADATLTTAGGNTYSDAAVKAAINGAIDAVAGEAETAFGLKADNADVETLRTETEARLDAIGAKVDAVLGALVDGQLMSAP